MPKWKVSRSSKKADEELAFLFANPEIEREIKRLLRLIQEEDDPRHPTHTDLNIRRIEHQAPKWYRLRIDRFNVRLVFRPLQIRGENLEEYEVNEDVWDDCENVFDIVKAGYRTPVFYAEVQRLYRKFHSV